MTVEGTLVDGVTLRPLTGVVTLLVQHPANVVSTTDIVEDGTFRIEDLPPGPGLLVGHADGYARAVSTVTMAVGDHRDVHLRLPVGAAASGHVLDSASNPERNAPRWIRSSAPARRPPDRDLPPTQHHLTGGHRRLHRW